MKPIKRCNICKKDVVKFCLSMSTEMAHNKLGSFFVITKSGIDEHYENLYPRLFENADVNINDKSVKVVLLKLSELDGAIILTESGKVVSYGAKIKKTRVLLGHGTRHSAARGISELKGVMSIISSEEDGMVRIFKGGRLIAEINPKTGEDQKVVDRLAELFSKPDIQIVTSGGVASILLGLNPLVAGIVFTGTWIMTKYGAASFKEFVRTGKIVVKKSFNKKELIKGVKAHRKALRKAARK